MRFLYCTWEALGYQLGYLGRWLVAVAGVALVLACVIGCFI